MDYADGASLLQPDMKNQLLPRSTGLLFSIRTLQQHIPDLALYDLTVGYPGMPAAAYVATPLAPTFVTDVHSLPLQLRSILLHSLIYLHRLAGPPSSSPSPAPLRSPFPSNEDYARRPGCFSLV